MSVVMEEEIKRWTARRKSALVLEIIQGKTTVATASRQFDLTPAEVESWVEDGKRGMENALRAKPLGNPPEKEVDLTVEFSPIEIEEVLHEEVAFFGKPDHQHLEASGSRYTGAGTVP